MVLLQLEQLVRTELGKNVLMSVMLEEAGQEVVSLNGGADGCEGNYVLKPSGSYTIKVVLVHEKEGKLPDVKLSSLVIVREGGTEQQPPEVGAGFERCRKAA
jgi:hypothetical protein